MWGMGRISAMANGTYPLARLSKLKISVIQLLDVYLGKLTDLTGFQSLGVE